MHASQTRLAQVLPYITIANFSELHALMQKIV